MRLLLHILCPPAICSMQWEQRPGTPSLPVSVSFEERQDFWCVQSATMHDQVDPIQMSTCRAESTELGCWSTSRREDRVCNQSSVWSGANAFLSMLKLSYYRDSYATAKYRAFGHLLSVPDCRWIKIISLWSNEVLYRTNLSSLVVYKMQTISSKFKN